MEVLSKNEIEILELICLDRMQDILLDQEEQDTYNSNDNINCILHLMNKLEMLKFGSD